MMNLHRQLVSVAFILTSIIFNPQQEDLSQNSAKNLIENVVSKTGNYKLLKNLKDVEFTYQFHNPNTNKNDISLERYIFEGEVSWGQYKSHEVFVLPNKKGLVTQYYESNGDSWMSLDGTKLTDSQQLFGSNFLRKANYYWFTMMPKLLDIGVTYELLPSRRHNNIDYNIVKIGYEAGIGDVQDDFILYIHPDTFLIDQFLFTVKGLGSLGVSLMEIKYETVNGYTFMAKRKVIPSDWDGSIKGDVLYEQTTTNVRFNNGFEKTILREE